jgi:D-alanine-D-alanine ligase
MKTIGLTYDLKTDYKFKEGDPADANAEFDYPSTVDVVASSIESLGFAVRRIGNVNNLLENIDSLGVDIVFNISEGLGGRNRESQVPTLLEMRNIPFVGSDALTQGLTLDKIMTKKILISEQLPTPRFIEAKDSRQANLDHLKFPLIVKPRFEGSSKGLSEKSRVENSQRLKEQVDFIVNTYHQPALVEEFVSGSEYTVALIGNDPIEALPPIQVKIDGQLEVGDLFYTFGRISSDRVEYICRTDTADPLMSRLMDLARRTYQAVDCRDFGRVDFRVDEKGNPYILEINPLPSLSTEDVFMIIAKKIGRTYDEMLARIIGSAFKRYGLNLE